VDNELTSMLVFRFTVESLVYAFHYLEGEGYRPVMDEDAGIVRVVSRTGAELPGVEGEGVPRTLNSINKVAPLAIQAFRRQGESTRHGSFARSAIGEAYDRYRQETEH
jgi:hypothetical protein